MAEDVHFFDGNSKTLDDVAKQLTEQARKANDDVQKAIDSLKGGADDPALLAEMQHKINKWSVIYSINATITRAMKDLMQNILQKI